MIREKDGRWFIFYASANEVFDGPFQSEGLAIAAFEAMRPVDKMLVSGRAPFLNTDSTFLKGTETTNGKKYLHQLARRPNDPRALVSSRGDVERICREDGMHCEGLVNVTVEEPEPSRGIPIDEKIVDRETAKVLKGTKGMPKKKQVEVREAVREKIKPKW